MDTSAAKSEILEGIRRHLAASKPFDALHEAHHAAAKTGAGVEVSRDYARDFLIETFKTNLESVAAHCAIVRDEGEAAEVLRKVIKATGAQKIAASDSPLVKRVAASIDAGFSENTPPEDLFDCDLGVTSAQFGIAETGTLVLESEKETHRLASLVPPVHVCVFRAAQIRSGLGEVLAELKTDLSRAVTFITGASRTSDIELTLAIGVHGPGQLFVILIDEE